MLYGLSGDPPTGLENTASSLAEAALNDERPMVLPPIPTELHVSGAKLTGLSQALAYKALRSSMQTPTRPRTVRMLEGIKLCVSQVNGNPPNNKQIWCSLRSKDLAKPLRVFLWKSMHNAYKIGSYWDKPSMSQELKKRSRCVHNGEIDSMDHILSKCSCPGQGLIWNLADALWKRKTGSALHRQDLFTIPRSPLMRIKDESGKTPPCLSRLYRIVLLEAAYLIWVLRCERVIRNNDSPYTPTEIINRGMP